MRRFEIHPDVNCVNAKSGTLYDKSKSYTEDHWNEGEADDYVKTGFLVEVELGTAPGAGKSALKEFKK